MPAAQPTIDSKFRTSPFEVVTEGLGYPEGPVYMPDGSVLVCEIMNGNLTRVWPDGTKVKVAEVHGGPNGAAIGPDGAVYICNDGGFQFFRLDHALNAMLGPGKLTGPAAAAAAGIWLTGDQCPDYKGGTIQRVDLKTGLHSTLYSGFVNPGRSILAVETHSLRSPDDLVFDASGGFWFTDWGKQHDRSRDITGVYYARPDGSFIEEMIFPLNAPNGIALSPDGKRLYVAETYAQRVLFWELDAPGEIRLNPQSYNGGYVLCGGFPGMLDSMAVDEQGNVYVATLAKNGLAPVDSGITIVSPEGEILEFMDVSAGAPDPMPSNICFGGPDLQTAYITMAGTGRLVSCRMRVPGLRLAFQ
jgi:gluconolactonase